MDPESPPRPPSRKSSLLSRDPHDVHTLFRQGLRRSSLSFESLRGASMSMYRSSTKSLGIPEKTDPPPNGGWGWVVVISAFLIHMNVLGLQYSFGVIYKALRDDPTLEGGGSRAAAAVAGSMASSLMLLFSLPAGILVKHFGPRIVSASGALLIALGLMLSSMTSDLRVLYVTYGIISGIGYGICWAPSVMAVNMYFTTRRALASGVAVAGSGVGTIVYANVCNHLIEQAGWRGAMLQLAVIAGASNLLSALTFFPVGKEGERGSESQSLSAAAAAAAAAPQSTADSLESGRAETGKQCLLAADAVAKAHAGGPDTAPERPASDSKAAAEAKLKGNQPPAVLEAGGASEMELRQHSLVRADSLQSGEDTARDCAEGEEAEAEAAGGASALPTLSLVEMLANRPMQVVSATMFVYAGAIWIPYTFLVSYAQGRGGMAPENAANLVAVIGFASTVGRVVIGAATDRFGIGRLLQASMLITGGSLVGLAVVPPSLATLLAFSVVFGAFAGSVVAMIGPLLVEQLGIHNLPTAFGLAAALQAPAVVIGPPLGGWLRDVSGGFVWTWAVPGVLLGLVSVGISLLPEPSKAQRRAAFPGS